MKLSRDESRAVAFIGLLLALSAGVRLVDRPAPVEVDGPGVDLAELEAASRRKLRGGADGPVVPPVSGTPTRAASQGRASAQSRADTMRSAISSQPIDVNRANLEELTRLPGIGDVLARRIIAYRDSIGGFRTVDQLEEVRGIGPAMLRRLETRIRIGS
jgi:competence ComEA-like helix-hairpin-helix protein